MAKSSEQDRETRKGQIDINSARREELTLIEGIDDERARLIIEYREEHGPFRSWDDLERVPGIGGTLRAKAQEAATAGGARSGRGAEEADRTEEAQGAEEEAEEASSSSDDQDSVLARELDELAAVAQLDREAAVAYRIVAENVPVAEVRDRLTAFREDHLRHVRLIAELVHERGFELADDDGSAELSAIAALAAAAVEMGTKAALLAMISNERLTNGTYESALLIAADPQARALLQRNFADEQRHLQWLEENKDRGFQESAQQGAGDASP